MRRTTAKERKVAWGGRGKGGGRRGKGNRREGVGGGGRVEVVVDWLWEGSISTVREDERCEVRDDEQGTCSC